MCYVVFSSAGTAILVDMSAPTGQKNDEILYVLAPRGLNLRATANAGSEKLLTVPYGAAVSLLEAPAGEEMLVDNLPGGMAKVRYGDQVGYMFDGYLCSLPAPVDQDEHDIHAYVDRARGVGRQVYYEKCERDYDGYYQTQENITPFITDWAEAYLLAQRLFKIPEKLLFPKPSSEQEQGIENPDKEAMVWEDSLQVKRDEQGGITEITYYFRQEGGGRVINIIRDPEQESLMISQVLIAD